ncbi:molecular chaperone DnaK [Vibrio cortegadensis]|uniref:Molecular chaperone DnaK n=1 Tax=Vibrio cortegadensis TaxID=1328770 RepID=A0ABV4M5D8_9VIBR
MTTALVNKFSFSSLAEDLSTLKKNNESELIEREITLFKKGEKDSEFLMLLLGCSEKFDNAWLSSRWMKLDEDRYLDAKQKCFWYIPNSEEHKLYILDKSGIDASEIEDKFNSESGDSLNYWLIPDRKTLISLKSNETTPFDSYDFGIPKPYTNKYYRCEDGQAKGLSFSNGKIADYTHGVFIGYLKIPSDSDSWFISSLVYGFTPEKLKNDKKYRVLVNLFHYLAGELANGVDEVERLIAKLKQERLSRILLTEDTLRSDISSYNKKILDDTELGHWSLWQDELDTNNWAEINLPTKLVARDPKSSINDGVVAIDFGTKSTVVVYQKDNVNIHPMRIGTGDLSKEIASHHYENPTIMEFINLESFTSAYNAKTNKPYTRWKDLTISHTAQNSMQGSESSKFNTFLDEIKQWAGDKNRKLKIVGQHGKIIDLPPFLELTDDDFNPIEIYAYYLGLYINNLNNGIFMDYILSFPVTYEMPIRDKIIESFEKGLKKSLPAELGEESIDKLTVTKGASEPAAYALTALQQYGFEPEDDERVFYSVFDFGGGTTDFDFGIFSEPTDRKDKRRFDYVIEHFGAGGDKFLGGENLLELLAFEVFKKNKVALLEKGIQFEKHPEKDSFAGSEQLLSNSQEARMNTKQLCIALRPYWEEHEDSSFDASGELSVTLTDINGIQHSAFALDIDEEDLNQILSDRIERGVENFFNALRLAFSHSRLALTDIDNVKIFLAGNSSQSSFVNPLFEKHIAIQHQEMGISEGESRFELFAPLGADKDDVEKPTGKTGVAFGLIESRAGGSIKVIDRNIANEDVRFKYYLGRNRKKKFKPQIDREVKFHQWNDFIYADEDTFEIFFTDQPSSSTGQVSISDSSIKKKVVKLDVTDEDALVYIRVVSPTAIEYVVANEEDIANEQYLNDIKRIEL